MRIPKGVALNGTSLSARLLLLLLLRLMWLLQYYLPDTGCRTAQVLLSWQLGQRRRLLWLLAGAPPAAV
jgi:hypothetical protein